MKTCKAAIAWHVHLNEDGSVYMRHLALEKRNGRAVYPGDSYTTWLCGEYFAELTDADVDKMRQYAKDNGYTLTTDRVIIRYK